MICGICASPKLRLERQSPQLEISVCAACGHRIAKHFRGALASDYHAQYESEQFVESLRATRLRQASSIIATLKKHAPTLDRVFDFGSGRGWFLRACRDAGMNTLVGADTSAIAIDLLNDDGIAGIRLDQSWAPHQIAEMLPFRPEVLSVLDVIEHFEAHVALEFIAGLVSALQPELRMIVMKVPVSNGFLYRFASTLARFGLAAFLEQLYQVGTSPPHVQYFSRQSATLFLRHAGLQPIAMLRDRDFEGRELGQRVNALRNLPRVFASAIGWSLERLIDTARLQDSVILVASAGP
jgi:hypothetical protein